MAGNRRSEDAGDVPWPALVDLLTSVLITFMFFILVTTIAMSAMTLKQAETAQTNREEEQAEDSETETMTDAQPLTPPTSAPLLNSPEDLPDMAEALQHELETLSAQLSELQSENENLKSRLASMGSSYVKPKDIRVITDSTILTLIFNPAEAGMLPEAEVALAKYVSRFAKPLEGDTLIEVRAAEPDGLSLTHARERALTRAMIVRNVLLENGVPAERIRFKYSSDSLADSRNWVRISLQRPNKETP